MENIINDLDSLYYFYVKTLDIPEYLKNKYNLVQSTPLLDIYYILISLKDELNNQELSENSEIILKMTKKESFIIFTFKILGLNELNRSYQFQVENK